MRHDYTKALLVNIAQAIHNDSMKTEEGDIESILKAENAEFIKDQEINRILMAFKLDAYSVLDILPGCTTKDIRNIFRKKSLLIHPDKTTNERAPGN